MINGMRLTTILPLLTTLAAWGQNATFEGQPATTLANDKLEILVLKQGASVASIVLKDDPAKRNPLWEPARMAREAGGRGAFSSGTGHFLCVDGFGGVSPEEKAAGLPGHGEAHLVEFDMRLQDGRLSMTTALPLTQETLTRTMTLRPGENVVIYDTTLESQLAFDRPVLWAEHATIGSPFLAPGVTVVDFPALHSKTRPHERAGNVPYRLASDVEFTWPNAPLLDGKTVNLRAAPEHPNSGDHTASLVDPKRALGFVTAINPRDGLIVGEQPLGHAPLSLASG
jgi:hypothetical protein